MRSWSTSPLGHTAAVARAIGEGIGPETEVLTTDAVTPAVLEAADLVIAGAPTMAFRLPTDAMLQHVADDPKAPSRAMSPIGRSARGSTTCPEGRPAAPSFRGRVRDRAPLVTGRRQGRDRHRARRLDSVRAPRPMRFFVEGSYGPLRDGELDRARAWGAALAGPPVTDLRGGGGGPAGDAGRRARPGRGR